MPLELPDFRPTLYVASDIEATVMFAVTTLELGYEGRVMIAVTNSGKYLLCMASDMEGDDDFDSPYRWLATLQSEAELDATMEKWQSSALRRDRELAHLWLTRYPE